MSEKKSAWRSPWVIAWIGLVLVVLLVNIIMIFLAIENDPGLVVEDYYERGQDYEDHVLERQRKNPGWQMKIEVPATLVVGENAEFRFSVMDKAGQPVAADGVELFAYRPSDARKDFSVPMAEVAPGRYLADVAFPLLGVWDVLASVRLGEDEYNSARRIQVSRVPQH